MSELKCPNIKIYKCSDGFVTDNAQVAKSHEANIKSNKLKCPFCQQELEYCGTYIDGTKKLWCDNCKLFGDNRLFEKLIRTRKALEIAVDALDRMVIDDNVSGIIARNAIKEIKALEQKDE